MDALHTNPYTPGFGTSPRLLAGRDHVVGLLSRAFGPSFDPHRTTWLQAPRGAGKTVLLNEVQDLAGQAGWIVVQEDAQMAGLCDRITRSLATRLTPPRRRRLKSASMTLPVLGVGGTVEYTDLPQAALSLRAALEAVLDLPDAPAGVFITVDEIHSGDRDDIATLGNAIQHLIRGDRPVAIMFAGLPQNEDDDRATFLTRCTTPELDRLDDSAVALGLNGTARLEGGRFQRDALHLAVDAVAGYPYMLQLLGYWAWEAAAPDRGGNRVITAANVRSALPHALRDLERAVLQPSAKPLSPLESAYLDAMAVDDGPSQTATVASRLGRSAQNANQYRNRLIAVGLVAEVSRGLVDFTLPGHRAHIRTRNHLQSIQRSASVGAGLEVSGERGIEGAARGRLGPRPDPRA